MMTGEPVLAEKTAVVTGATSGIGLYSLIALVKAGAFGIGVGRDPQRCMQAQEQVQAVCPGGQVCYLVAELSRQTDIHRLADEIEGAITHAGHTTLDVLVNNAGTYSGRRIYTEDGVELMLAVNHIAPFLLTQLLLPLLESAPAGRILTVSSASHYHARLNIARLNHPLIYFGLDRYQVTKLANVLFTCELNRRLTGTRVRAFAIDPGLVNTAVGQKNSGMLASFVWKIRRKKGCPPDVPARTVLFLSTEPSLQNSQEYYWRDCKPQKPSRKAECPDLSLDLWRKSLELCGLDGKTGINLR